MEWGWEGRWGESRIFRGGVDCYWAGYLRVGGK